MLYSEEREIPSETLWIVVDEESVIDHQREDLMMCIDR